jgi:hypothetical protein
MKLKYLSFLILIGIWPLLMPESAFAAKECYSRTELRAEQLLRLHSELMVISYACKRSSQGFDLVSVYTAFTQSNLPELQKAEKTLTNYYKTEFGGDGLAQLDDLHTKLGNEAGQTVADESLEAFCDRNRDVPLQMFFASPKQVDDELKRMVATTKSYGPLCKVAIAKSR